MNSLVNIVSTMDSMSTSPSSPVAASLSARLSRDGGICGNAACKNPRGELKDWCEMADESEAVELSAVSAQKSGQLLDSSVVMHREERCAESSSSASSCSYCSVAWFASSLRVVRSASTCSDGGEEGLKSAISAARRVVSRGGQNSACKLDK